MIEGCVVQWKGQTLRLFFPIRTLSTSLRITFGIPRWSYYFTELFVKEIDLARIALSCHFALDLSCVKAGTHDSA